MHQIETIMEERTFKNFYQSCCDNYGDKLALTLAGSDQGLSYRAVKEKIEALHTLLAKQGIIKGDKVALLGENSPHWGVAYLAITSMGAVVVPILPDFHPNEIRHILRHSEAKGFIVSEKNHALLIDQNFDDLAFLISLNSLTLIDEKSAPNRLKALIVKQKARLKSLRKRSAKEDLIDTVGEDDLAALIYTSGTTGHSKGVMLSHKNIISNAIATRSVIEVLPSDRFLSVLPLAHTFECTVGFITPFLYGASIHYIDKAPTPRILVSALAEVKPTFMLAVPLIIEKIYKSRIAPNLHQGLIGTLYKIKALQKILHRAAGKKLLQTFGGELRFFGIGGASLAAHVEAFLRDANFPYAIGYGLTETAPIVAGAGPGVVRYRSTGPQLEGVELKLVDVRSETGEGEIVAKGANVMLGYYKDAALTEAVIKEGWFYTGDLGYFDQDGHLYIKGRSKNVIVGASGENIYPEQIESIFNAHEYVVESLVYEKARRVVAKLFLDYDLIDQKFQTSHYSESQAREMIGDILNTVRSEVNLELSSFSKVTACYEQREEFEKTPTKKIKRFMHID